MAQITNEFAHLEMKDQSGAVHRLGALWAERPAVLLFLRHFG